MPEEADAPVVEKHPWDECDKFIFWRETTKLRYVTLPSGERRLQQKVFCAECDRCCDRWADIPEVKA